jgi:hypothetical protein
MKKKTKAKYRAVARAASRWFPTSVARVRARDLFMWNLWWTKWRLGRFSPSTSVSPANFHSTNCSILYLLGLVQQANSSCGTKWTQSASELYRSSDRRRSAKLVPTLADRGCHVISARSPSYRNFDFLDVEPLLFLPSSSSNCSRG